MYTDIHLVIEYFRGKFVTLPAEILTKLENVKAFVFDWDGVFNDGFKDNSGSRPFSEVDSMGTNLLRFNHFLRKGEVPIVAIISGEHNLAARTFAEREHFNAVYSKVRHKRQAIEHLCATHNISPDEILFVFDDVLDFSAAEMVGLRIMVAHSCSPLLSDYADKHGLADYITAHSGGGHAIRESVELLTGLTGMYAETISHRVKYDETYQQYLQLRNQPVPQYFTSKDLEIVSHEP